MRCNRFQVVVAIVAVAVLGLAGSAEAAVLLSEDFESPDVTGYAQGTTPSDWLRASVGYRSNYHGIVDKDSGHFSAPSGNDQGYAFRYTNSGIVTVEGVIGELLVGDYTLTFDVVRDEGTIKYGDPGRDGLPYNAQLMAFDLGESRNDQRHDPMVTGTRLAKITGNAPADGSFGAVTLDLSVLPGDPNLGRDLAIRFKGATNTAIIDNVVLDGPVPGGVIPEPSTLVIWGLGLLGLLWYARRRRSGQ